MHGIKRSQVYTPSASSIKEKVAAEKAAAKGQRLSSVSVSMSDTQGKSKGDLDIMAMKAVEMLDRDGEKAEGREVERRAAPLMRAFSLHLPPARTRGRNQYSPPPRPFHPGLSRRLRHN